MFQTSGWESWAKSWAKLAPKVATFERQIFLFFFLLAVLVCSEQTRRLAAARDLLLALNFQRLATVAADTLLQRLVSPPRRLSSPERETSTKRRLSLSRTVSLDVLRKLVEPETLLLVFLFLFFFFFFGELGPEVDSKLAQLIAAGRPSLSAIRRLVA